jgi:hypothetical protein
MQIPAVMSQRLVLLDLSVFGYLVTFRLGLVVRCKRLIRTTIGTVLIHTVILPSRLLSHRCHVVCPVMCRSCVVLRSSLTFHGLLILVSVY